MTRYVVKVGGHALDSLRPDAEVLVALAHDVGALRKASVDVVIVHGGGPQIETLLEAVGLVGEFHDGLRITDEVVVEYVAMALSQVNLHLVSALNHAGLASVGLSGVDHSLLVTSAIGPPWGRVGAVAKVNVAIIETLWANGLTPVVSSISADSLGEFVNCNADTAAGALAGALDADALILLSDVDQLRQDPLDESSALRSVTAHDLRRLLDNGSIVDGMRPKMAAALDALDAGADRVVLAKGTVVHALRDALAGEARQTEVVR